MKKLLVAAALVAAVATPAAAGVSISVGEPGFYGHIEIGGFPPPPLIFPHPVIIEHVRVPGPPVYLHVPPGHAKHWDKHCHEYHACGQRVYFVQDTWYRDVYVPQYHERHYGGREHHEGEHGNGNEHGQGHGNSGHGHGHKH
jgi:hypothetical protein